MPVSLSFGMLSPNQLKCFYQIRSPFTLPVNADKQNLFTPIITVIRDCFVDRDIGTKVVPLNAFPPTIITCFIAL